MRRVALGLVLACLLVSHQGFAGGDSLRQWSWLRCPPKLLKLKAGLSERAVISILGRPGKRDSGHLYYDLGGRRFDTTLIFEHGGLASIYHEPRGKSGSPSPTVRDAELWFNASEITRARRSALALPENRAIRKFYLSQEREGVRLGFYDTPDAQLDSIWIKFARAREQ